MVIGNTGLDVPRDELYRKEGELIVSRSYGPGRYDPIYEEKGIDYPVGYVRWTLNRNMIAFLELLKKRKINIEPLISAVFDIEKAKEAYQLLLTNPDIITILFRYDYSKYIKIGEETELSIPKFKIGGGFAHRRKDKINIAIIGAGAFAKGTLIPLIKKISLYNLRAIVTARSITAKEACKKFRPEYCTTDYKQVLEDENIDAVIIATRHNLHSEMVINAAKAGKAIFVENHFAFQKMN